MDRFYLFFFLVLFVGLPTQAQPERLQTLLKSYQSGLAHAQAKHNIQEQAFYQGKLAHLYQEHKIFRDAFLAYKAQLDLETQRGDAQAIMYVHRDLGLLYNQLGQPKPALQEYERYVRPLQQSSRLAEMYEAFVMVSGLSWRVKHYKEAIAYLERALWAAGRLSDPARIQEVNLQLSQDYKALGNAEKAMQYYQAYAALLHSKQQALISRQHLENKSQDKLLQETTQELESEREKLREEEKASALQAVEIEMLSKDKAIRELKLKEEQQALGHQRTLNMLMLIGVAIAALLAFFLLRDYAKIRTLNEQLSFQNNEILQQKEEILTQNERLEASQTQLLDAKITIQEQNLKLQSYNRGLERQVEERTSALQKAYDKLLLINNDLDTLTYRASHDLKSPVASLNGLCDVAMLELSSDSAAVFYFEKIRHTSTQMAALLDNLSRLRDIKHAPVNPIDISLGTLVREIISQDCMLLPQAKNIHFELHIDETLGLHTDPALYRLILRNILLNAVQFSLPPTDNYQPYVRVEADSLADQTTIRIMDNGEGILPELTDKIFNMFFRGSLRSSGAGLGLYTARSAADRLGGSLEYQRGIDQRTLFVIRMPNAQSELSLIPESQLAGVLGHFTAYQG